MFTIINGGYAENVPGNSRRMDEIHEKNRKAIAQIDSLTIGFGVCAVTGASHTNGGYKELQPPVCPIVHKALTEDLRLAKEEMKASLVNPIFSADVLTLKF